MQKLQKYRMALLLIVLIIVILVVLIRSVVPEVQKIMSVESELKTKAIEVEDLERKAEELKKTEMETVAAMEQTKSVYKPDAGLDVESFTVMFDDIIEMAKYNGIKVYSIGYAYNPTEDEFVKGAPNKYNVSQVNMQIIADYSDTENFFKDIIN